MIEQHDPSQIAVQQEQNFLFSIVSKQAAFPDEGSGIVDDDIRHAYSFIHRMDETLDIIRLRDVGLHEQAADSYGGNPALEIGCLAFAMHIIQNNVMSGFGQGERGHLLTLWHCL